VIDPLDVMAEYGTDAFRFTLAAMAAMGRDIKLAEERISGYQNFVNKLWNASRFVLMNQVSSDSGEPKIDRTVLDGSELGLVERWIRSRLACTIQEARTAIDGYRFNDYGNILYQFTWHEFCDWYIEMSKLSLNGSIGVDPGLSRRMLVELLEQILLLLHPVMPFVTEEIWQVLGDGRASIMVQKHPTAGPNWSDAEAERQMEFLMGVVRAIRNLRTELNCPPGKEIKVIFQGSDNDLAFLGAQLPYLRALARVGSAVYLGSGDRPKRAATAVVGSAEIYLPIDDLVNLDEERVRLTKEVDKVTDEIARVHKKLGNPDFVSKAKQEVIQREREKAIEYQEKLRTLKGSLDQIEEIQAERN
jgi:valyl-tRNA synthetase